MFDGVVLVADVAPCLSANVLQRRTWLTSAYVQWARMSGQVCLPAQEWYLRAAAVSVRSGCCPQGLRGSPRGQNRRTASNLWRRACLRGPRRAVRWCGGRQCLFRRLPAALTRRFEHALSGADEGGLVGREAPYQRALFHPRFFFFFGGGWRQPRTSLMHVPPGCRKDVQARRIAE